jgi:S1-C subfamily serine protease
VLVLRKVTPGTGAAAAGLREGDVLVAVDGSAVTSPQAVSRILLRHHPQDTVPVAIRRRGRSLTLSVVLQEFGG